MRQNAANFCQSLRQAARCAAAWAGLRVGVIGDNKEAVANRLRIDDATPAEIASLTTGQQVELNSMTSDQFVRFVEDKLAARGVAKVVPETAMLSRPRGSPPGDKALTKIPSSGDDLDDRVDLAAIEEVAHDKNGDIGQDRADESGPGRGSASERRTTAW